MVCCRLSNIDIVHQDLSSMGMIIHIHGARVGRVSSFKLSNTGDLTRNVKQQH